ncbi:hypothetical protein HF872_09380 [Megasphaera hexanoica]|uniref:Uncharacterized protein n=1 Tax=Megasphaera hexanoica TaxID=1675036 RepID=A0A848C0S4_9FIRM|nr:hypothetical protein [Megasphaera hexanoica]NME28827.1 hypothetical protein [Megasphaera hexanoica]
MSERDFQTEVLERMARIDAQLKEALDSVHKLEEQFQETQKLAIVADQRGRSAHHRINGMYVIAGIIGGVISFVVDFFRH